MISYLQAILLGLLQGVSELFPISSLGHSVLFAWVMGWTNIVAVQSKTESFFLAFLVILHVGTALALLFFYRKIWSRIIRGFFRSIKNQRIKDPSERLAWLLIVATIPAGLAGVIFEHILRTQFAKPLAAAIFIIINGCILFIGDHYIRQHYLRRPHRESQILSEQQAASKLSFARALIVGTMQTFSFFAGISRSGITMVSGLYSGLDYEDAARFSFLLATPIILGAGVYKLPDFLGHLSDGLRGQIVVGGLAAMVAAYFAVRFLDKYFQNKTLRPFAIYCISIGVLMLLIGISGLRHF